jgi:hypothetical protein
MPFLERIETRIFGESLRVVVEPVDSPLLAAPSSEIEDGGLEPIAVKATAPGTRDDDPARIWLVHDGGFLPIAAAHCATPQPARFIATNSTLVYERMGGGIAL